MGKDKIPKIKMFMEQLIKVGFIVKRKNNKRDFELFCYWAGGSIARYRIGRKFLIACINPALLNNSSKDEILRMILSQIFSNPSIFSSTVFNIL